MARRAARTPELGPAIELDLDGCDGPLVCSATIVDLGPPGRRAAAQLRGAAARLRHHYAVVIAAHRGFDPRRQSVVERRVRGAAADVAAHLACEDGAFCFPGGGLDAPASTRMSYDPVEHEYRAPSGMHLRWAWPDLPVWLGVAELSATTCVLRLSLRSHRRLRYPARYFHTAHCALSAVEGRVLAAAP